MADTVLPLPAPSRTSSGFLSELSALARLAAPIAIAQAGQATMALVDTAVVGRVGAAPLAGVGLGNGLYIVFGIFGFGLVMGLDPLISQAFGAGEPLQARRWFWQGVWLSLIASAFTMVMLALTPLGLRPFGVADDVARETTHYVLWRVPGILPFLLYSAARSYLQAAGKPNSILFASLWANVLNFVLDVWFVFGGESLPAWTGPLRAMPALGSAGAALATTLCTTFQVAYVAAAVARIKVPAFSAGLRKPDRARIAKAFRNGWPIGLHLTAECGVFTLAGLLAGRMGSESGAAHQIALTYASLSFTLVVGIGSAGSVRVGWAVGARDTRGARRAGLVALAGGAALMSLWGLAFWTFPHALTSVMTNQPDVIVTAVPLLAVAAVFQISDGIQGVGAGVLRGAGDTRFIFLANMVGHYAIGFPVALVLGLWRGMGIVGIWWGLSVGLTAVAVSLYARFWRLSSKEIRPLAEH